MVEIKEMLAPLKCNCRPGDRRVGNLGVTIHETGNCSKSNGALKFGKYLQKTGINDAFSWHYAVDDHLITRSIPEREIAWHAGDGRTGNGNAKTIGVEICINCDSNYEIAKRNAAELSADILMRNGFHRAEEALFVNKNWTGKNSPAKLMEDNKWEEFRGMVQMYMDRQIPNPPNTHKANFTVFEDIPGYFTADDAVKGINQKTLVKKGEYFVFRQAIGAVNVTKTDGIPGSWINTHVNAMAKLAEIKVGDTVKLSGYVYADSFGNGAGYHYNNEIGKITLVTDLTRDCPYHFENLGWVKPDSVEHIYSKDQVFNIGDEVKIKQSATNYSRSDREIQKKYKDKSYTIGLVGDEDLLIRELYSWVKKYDVKKL